MVRARDQIVRADKDHTAGNSTRRKEERQTEEEMGGQYKGVDRTTAERYLEEDGESRGMEGVGCQDTCGAPTVHDYAIGEGEGEDTWHFKSELKHTHTHTHTHTHSLTHTHTHTHTHTERLLQTQKAISMISSVKVT